MNRFLLVALVLVSAVFAQEASPRTATAVVRMINVHADPSLPQIALPALFEAWKGVGLNSHLTAEQLVDLADRVGVTIQRAYEQVGSAVIVTHEIEILPPVNRQVDVRFRVSPAPAVH